MPERHETVYSLVIPVYRNLESLPDLLHQLRSLDDRLGRKLQVVFVVDGSPDDSYAWLRRERPRSRLAARLVLLSRNFGSFSAIRAGLAEASGPYFAVIAADLQEPPELALQFFATLSAGEVDVVVGSRESRDDPLLCRLASRLFWSAYRRTIQPEIPAGGIDLFGCNRTFRDHLVRLDETNTSLVALLYWLGFRRSTIHYQRRARPYGRASLRPQRLDVWPQAQVPRGQRIRILGLAGPPALLRWRARSAAIVARSTHTLVIVGPA